MFVGVGASRVRDMFEQAKKQSPCIIFIDEIDAVGDTGRGFGRRSRRTRTDAEPVLVEMDGFELNDGVIVIAATNRPDVLIPLLARAVRPASSGRPAHIRGGNKSESPHAQGAAV